MGNGGHTHEREVITMEKVKISVNLTTEDVDALKSLAEKRGSTVTETLRRAIAMEKFVDDVTSKGGTLVVEDQDKTLRRLLVR